MIRLLLSLLVLSLGVAWADSLVVSGKSGIESIDTLPTYEWDVKTDNNSLAYTLLWGAVVPGGAQFYTGHKVRGGFLFALEAGLAYEVFINKPMQQDRRFEEARAARDTITWITDSLLRTGEMRTDWLRTRERNMTVLRYRNDTKMKEEDLRRSEFAWMLGLHFYGLMDGYGIWKNNQGRSTEKRQVKDAVLRAMLVPGLGQFYNGEYGKAGLLYMSFLGGSVSLWTRQGMVDYFKERRRTAIAENASLTERTMIDEDVLFFRKKRNQYIWGMALFYLYSIADAAVDAALSDFDSPLFWALAPSEKGSGVAFTTGFDF